MATTVARLQAFLGADTSEFDRKMRDSGKTMGKTGKAAGILGFALAGGLAIATKHAINDASNLHEQINKTEVVFRKNGTAVVEWSKHLSKSFGLSDRAALEFAGTFGNMLKPMGLSIPLTTKMSKKLVELSGDMASFNNASIEDTLHAIQSGLGGQVRPLRQYGVFLDQTRIKLEAVDSGLVKAQVDHAKLTVERIKLNDATEEAGKALAKYGKGSEEYAKAAANVAYEESKVSKLLEGKVPALTSAQKAQASYNLIVRDTADAHGDFARTSGGLANQQRILQAQYENMSAQLGMVLLPIMTKLMGVVIQLTTYFSEHSSATKILAAATAALAAGLIATSVACKLLDSALVARLIPALGRSTAAMLGFDAAADANPIAAITVAILALAAALVVLQLKYQGVTRAVDFLRVNWNLLLVPISANIAAAAFLIKKFDLVQNSIQALNASIHAMVRALEKVVAAFKWIIDNAKKIGGVFGSIGGALGSAKDKLNPFGDAAGGVQNAVKNAGGGAAEGRAFNVGRQLWDEIGIGEKFGLRVTSGYRPGAVTKHGTPSDHGRNPSAAVDMAGSASGMAGFFTSLIGRREIRQAFYDPLGSIFGGVLSSYREGGHSDHVHVAEYDRGGFLQPGWNLAYNGLGRPEPVGGNVTIPISLGGEHVATVVFDMLRRKAKVFENRNGRPAFGGV